MNVHSIISRIYAALLIGMLSAGAATAMNAVPDRNYNIADIQHDDTIAIPIGETLVQLYDARVIDEQALLARYAKITDDIRTIDMLHTMQPNDSIIMDEHNADVLLDILWGVGLANAHPILSADMRDARYGGDAARFASTGGWRLGQGDVMSHYGAHDLAKLETAEQERVTRVARNVYRPCCNNATHFPDCNHGMAMLGMLELLAANGADEEELYRAAYAANRLWFPDTYELIERYVETHPSAGYDAADLVGREYASAGGVMRLREAVATQENMPQRARASSC